MPFIELFVLARMAASLRSLAFGEQVAEKGTGTVARGLILQGQFDSSDGASPLFQSPLATANLAL